MYLGSAKPYPGSKKRSRESQKKGPQEVCTFNKFEPHANLLLIDIPLQKPQALRFAPLGIKYRKSDRKVHEFLTEP